MTRLLIFDWDGTLIDSADRIVTCMQRAATDEGLAMPGADAVRNIIGLGLPEAVEAIYPGLDAEHNARVRASYSRHFLAGDEPPSPLFAGVREGLQRLAERGYVLAVATGKSRRGLDRALDETGLGGLFSHSRCADETRSKPHPLMLQELLQEVGVSAAAALMVGDTEYDLEMALNAAMPAVGVSYGAHSVARLLRHQPLMVIDRFAALEQLLEARAAS